MAEEAEEEEEGLSLLAPRLRLPPLGASASASDVSPVALPDTAAVGGGGNSGNDFR